MPSSNLLLASKIVTLEEPPSIRNIPAAPTAIAGFAGVTERGPVRKPQFVTSWDEFVEIFGGFIASSDLPLSVWCFFLNGGTAAWISRVTHYTDINDASTTTAVQAELTIKDRGGVAGPAVLDSVDGPFDLEPTEQLTVNLGSTGAVTVVFTAVYALATTGNETFVLTNGMTLKYQVKPPGSNTLSELKTITFSTGADFSNLATATAAEVAAVINRDGFMIKGVVVGTAVQIRTTKRGAQASLKLDAASTSLAALGLTAATTTGSGNVNDINTVTATEIAALQTAVPLTGGTSTVVGAKVRLTTTATGAGTSAVVTNATTALGIFSGSLPITQPGTAALESDTIKVKGKNPGNWISTAAYKVAIEDATSEETDRFNFRIKKGKFVETWPNLSMDSADPRYFEDFINAHSKLVEVEDLASPATSPDNLPALGEYGTWLLGNDGLVGLVDADYTGSDAGDTGLYAFDEVDNLTLLTVPGRATAGVHNAMITYGEVHRTGYVFVVPDPPSGLDEQEIKTYFKTTASLQGLSEYFAFYWPRGKIQNPSTAIYGPAAQIVVPPAGAIAGMFARTDASQLGGVFQPPAGTERGRLFGFLGFETDDVLDERKRDVVYPERINPISKDEGTGIYVDGTKTGKADGNFPTVAERRGVIFIQVSLKRGLLFAKHRNNDRRLRMEVKRAIETFLLRQDGVGAFRGRTPKESFYVDVSDAINPPEVVFANELRAKIGLATQKPADFIVLTFTQDTRELEDRLASALGG